MQHKADKDGHDMNTLNGIQETMLEFIETDNGDLVLRDAKDSDQEPLVKIQFSDKVKQMLGNDAQYIGQHMIHAAIQAVMHKQFSQWHANVYDEEPQHYS